jgi:hypothetical protein
MTRPSPTESATLHAPGTCKEGNDGRMYVVSRSAKTGVQRWVPVKDGRVDCGIDKQKKQNTSKHGEGKKHRHRSQNSNQELPTVAKRVNVVCNGAIPFVVELSNSGTRPGRARVLAQRADLSDDELDRLLGTSINPAASAADRNAYYQPWATFDYQRALVGMDMSEMTQQAQKGGGGLFFGLGSNNEKANKKQHQWWHGGNTVLLHLKNGKYVFVGDEVIEFQVDGEEDDIVAYVSRMGNSAVPYPYAIGRRRTYLLLERTYIENSDLLMFYLQQRHDAGDRMLDPYDAFYQYNVAAPVKSKFVSVQERNRSTRAHKAAHPLRGMRVLHEMVI